MSEGYCWILKLLSGPTIFKLLILCGNELISTGIPLLLMSLFLLFLEKENSQIFNEYFYLPLYLPLQYAANPLSFANSVPIYHISFYINFNFLLLLLQAASY